MRLVSLWACTWSSQLDLLGVTVVMELTSQWGSPSRPNPPIHKPVIHKPKDCADDIGYATLTAREGPA